MKAGIGDTELFLSVVRPIAAAMHSGKEADHKLRFYQELSKGEQAAFMYWVFHSHAACKEQFYTWIPYMRHADQGYWEQLWHGMKLIGCAGVLQLMERCDQLYEELERDKTGWAAYQPADLAETGLRQRVEVLYLEFEELKPRAMEMIGRYIKDRPEAFTER